MVPVTAEATVPVTLTALVAFAGVIFAVPSKLVPPIVLAVSSAVAVAALPVVS